MTKIKIGILRETKKPEDRRVALGPDRSRQLLDMFPNVELFVQPSPFRCFTDEEFKKNGIMVQENLSGCDILFGIKEVDKATLMEDKKYFFFSHTIKKQPYNREMLKEILKKNIQLIDYECLTDSSGNRIIGFGRYAGIVGAYNGIRAYGLKYKLFDLKPAHRCENKNEMNAQLKDLKLPPIKIAVTGGGRVANGVTETLGAMRIRKVTPFEFMNFTFTEAVYCQLHSKDYYVPKDGSFWNAGDFYDRPVAYSSVFKKYCKVTDMLITSHFWSPDSDKLFSLKDMCEKDFKIKVVADISCDINGSVPSTLRATSIDNPFYDFDPTGNKEFPSFTEDKITVMAVDNLPCELPRDASSDFGKELIEKVFPSLLNGKKEEALIERASITKAGKLTAGFEYLSDYVSV